MHYWVKVVYVSSPILEKSSRFSSPVLGIGSIGSKDQNWEKVLL